MVGEYPDGPMQRYRVRFTFHESVAGGYRASAFKYIQSELEIEELAVSEVGNENNVRTCVVEGNIDSFELEGLIDDIAGEVGSYHRPKMIQVSQIQ